VILLFGRLLRIPKGNIVNFFHPLLSCLVLMICGAVRLGLMSCIPFLGLNSGLVEMLTVNILLFRD